MADKDVEGLLRPLLNCFDIWYLASPDISRAMEVSVLAEKLRGLREHIKVFQFSSVVEASEAAQGDAQSGDRIVVFGSFYTVAEAMPETL
jgi:dihydrofolate synthase/folylpolyglutamate synthase